MAPRSLPGWSREQRNEYWREVAAETEEDAERERRRRPPSVMFDPVENVWRAWRGESIGDARQVGTGQEPEEARLNLYDMEDNDE